MSRHQLVTRYRILAISTNYGSGWATDVCFGCYRR